MLNTHTPDELGERFRTLIETLPDAIFFKDGEGRWRIVNSSGLRLFGLFDKAWEGCTDRELGACFPELAEYFEACHQNDELAWAKGNRHEAIEHIPDPASGERLTFEVTKIPLFHPDGVRRGLVAVGRNITARRKAEESAGRLQKSLRHLSEIAAFSHLPLADQLRKALSVGAAHFGLELGIISEISGDRYLVVSQISPPGVLQDGQTFPFGDTYCSITVKEQRVVGISHMGASVYMGHPCYQAFRLEAYIGAPVLVAGEIVGTVNFSSPNAYCRRFDDGDMEFMLLLSRWVGSAIERDQIQQRLKDREQEGRTILEKEPECVKLLAPDGQLLQINHAGLDMLQVASYEEARDIGLINFVRPEYRHAFSVLHQKVFNGEEAALEFQLIGKRGRPLWLETHAAPLCNDAGEVTALIAVTRDITNRKEAEERLRKSEHRYRTLFDNMLEGVAQCRMVYEDGRAVDFVYESVNPAFGKLTGLTQIVGRKISEIIPGIQKANPELFEIYGRVAQTGIAEQFETYVAVLKIWFAISVYSSEPGTFVAVFNNVTARKQAEETARHLAYFDSLTDLPNRRMLEDRLDQGLINARRYHRSLAVMFMDLDNFKNVNDTHGHHVGDQLLQVVADRLKRCIRAGDTVGRSGGDEFIIVLPEISNPEDAEIVAKKIIAAVDAPITIGGACLHVGASIGVAVYPVSGTDDAPELMKKADQAMYQAKQAGRNRYQLHGAALN